MKLFWSKRRTALVAILSAVSSLLLFLVPIIANSIIVGELKYSLLLFLISFVLFLLSLTLIFTCFFSGIAMQTLVSDVTAHADGVGLIIYSKTFRKANLSNEMPKILDNELLGGYIDEKSYFILMKQLTSEKEEGEDEVYRFDDSQIYLKVSTTQHKDLVITFVNDVTELMLLKRNRGLTDASSPVTGLKTRDAFKRTMNLFIGEETPFFLAQFRIEGADRIVSMIGYEKVNTLVVSVAQMLKKYESRSITVGERSKYEFYMSLEGSNKNFAFENFRDIYRDVSDYLDGFSEENKIALKLFCGYCHFTTNSSDVDELSSMAEFAIFDAKSREISLPCAYSTVSHEENIVEFKKLQFFNETIGKNMLTYHFQPIVSASTGDIVGYEALMRTVGDFVLTPLDMLKFALEHNSLREIERLTLFNTFEYVYENTEHFFDKKLFVNSIPGSFLTESEYKRLVDYYAVVFPRIVIEVTESRDIDEKTVKWLREHFVSRNSQLALDDYGTGYANESNLLKVQPDYIKIDHSMISGISRDLKKQQLVKNMIAFANLHGITTLAEGVETREDLEMVVSLDIGMIQGFYTAQPAAEPVEEIDPEIKSLIINTRLKNAGYVTKTFKATNGCSIDIVAIALEGYNNIEIDTFCHCVSLIGDTDKLVRMSVMVAENTQMTINMMNCFIRGINGGALRIGNACDVSLALHGDNVIENDGILVPEDAATIIKGDGNLTIRDTHNAAVIIGGNVEQSFGHITFDGSGIINVSCNGDDEVGIGGGIGVKDKSEITILNGTIISEARGINAVAVGCHKGDVIIQMSEGVSLSAETQGHFVVAVGSIEGNVMLNSLADMKLVCGGDTAVGVGVIREGSFKAEFSGGLVDITAKAKVGVCVGTVSGELDCGIHNGTLILNGEGDTSTALGTIGSKEGKISIYCGVISASSRSAHCVTIGAGSSPIRVNGGNIITDPSEPLINAADVAGRPLTLFRLKLREGQRFVKEPISYSPTERNVFYADASSINEYLWAYLPADAKPFDCESYIKQEAV